MEENLTEEKNINYEYYRHTPISDLKSIMIHGLNPNKAESNLRRFIFDDRQKIFYSEGKEGVITCDCGFRSKFKQLKDKKSQFYDEKFDEYNTIDDFLKANDRGQDRVFLRIKDIELINEQDLDKDDRFADAYTSQTIPPEKIRVCLLKDPKTNKLTYKREDVLKHMMSKCSVEDIKNKYQIDKKGEEKLYNQYEEMKDEINEFSKYEMIEMEVEQFLQILPSIQKGQDGKSGFEDCIKDDKTKLSIMQNITINTRNDLSKNLTIEEQTNDERFR